MAQSVAAATQPTSACAVSGMTASRTSQFCRQIDSQFASMVDMPSQIARDPVAARGAVHRAARLAAAAARARVAARP